MNRTTNRLLVALSAALPVVWAAEAAGYNQYNDGCQVCHGAFTDATSPQGNVFPSDSKHEMHRGASNMNTECNLCHTNGDKKNPYLGSSNGTGNNVGVGCCGCHGCEQDAGPDQCTSCHDQHDKSKQTYLALRGEALCFTCHDITANTPGMHHIPDRHNPWDNFRCTMCHGTLLDGTPAEGGDGVAPACTTCHNPFAVPDTPPGGHHGDNRFLPYFYCGACHADPLTGVLTGNDFGTGWAPSCFQCHGDPWNAGNNPPATPTMADLTGFVGQSVVFDASHIVDPEGDPLAYVWSFGDGTQVAFPSHSSGTTHAYEHYGTYTATLAISDAVNPPVYVEFTVTISSQPEEPVADRWVVTTTAAPAEVFTITIESHSGALVVVKDDGDVNTPDSLAYGVEFEDVIFWMDIWMDLSGNVYWGTGDVYFGNIDRNAGSMVGVVFDDQGGVVTFAATKESAL